MRCGVLLSMIAVCRSVCHMVTLCKHGWMDRDPIWVGDSCGSKAHFARWRSWSARGKREKLFDRAIADLLLPVVWLDFCIRVSCSSSAVGCRQRLVSDITRNSAVADKPPDALCCQELLSGEWLRFIGRILRLAFRTAPDSILAGFSDFYLSLYVWRPQWGGSKRSNNISIDSCTRLPIDGQCMCRYGPNKPRWAGPTSARVKIHQLLRMNEAGWPPIRNQFAPGRSGRRRRMMVAGEIRRLKNMIEIQGQHNRSRLAEYG